MSLTPEARAELEEIIDRLGAWLTDHTDTLFDEEPEVDSARVLLLQRMGEL